MVHTHFRVCYGPCFLPFPLSRPHPWGAPLVIFIVSYFPPCPQQAESSWKAGKGTSHSLAGGVSECFMSE